MEYIYGSNIKPTYIDYKILKITMIYFKNVVKPYFVMSTHIVVFVIEYI